MIPTEIRNIVVGIGGASSSGKSTIAKLLHSVIDGSILLQQDDFFKPDEQIPVDPKTGMANWDCPEALNMDAFAQEIKRLKCTGTLNEHNPHNVHNYSSDTKDQDFSSISPDTIQSMKDQLTPLFNNKRLVIVDGFMIFHDPQIIKLFDVRIFIQCSYDTLKQRREARAGYLTQDSFWVDPPGYFDSIVYPAYAQSHKYLFNDDDVEGEFKIDDPTITSLGIDVISNNNGIPIDSTIKTVSKTLQQRLLHLQ